MNIHTRLYTAVIKKKKALVIATAVIMLAAASLIAPGLSAKNLIYADSKATGSMDGSASKPYKSIQDAIDKAKKEKKNVVVKKGTYTENITIKNDVEVNGESKDAVIIIAKDSSKAVVTMEDDTELRKVTVKNGERGVVIEENAKATVEKCNVVNNKKDGIKVKEGKTDSEHTVTIFENNISDNGWNGMYAEERKLTIMHNDIIGNDRDGIELTAGTEAYLEDNHIRYSGGHALKVTIDESEIWTYNNTFYESEGHGLEVITKGKEGKLGIKRSKFYRNDDYGIAKIAEGSLSDRQWSNSVLIQEQNLFWDNSDGDISPVISR